MTIPESVAPWWEVHKKADEERESREAAELRKADIKAKLYEKLTPEERKALGL